MRFLHIADLHLGKRWNDVDLLEDQLSILKDLQSMALEQKVDAVLIAGDVYQKASPSAEAMAAFDRFVSFLAGKGIRVFAISGNHDSEQRISYFSELVRRAGVYVSESFDGTLQQIELQDEYGPLVISLLPFVRPFTVRRCFPEDKIETTQDAVKAVLDRSPVDESKRNVLLCHQFVTGAELSDSEERTVGGLDGVEAGLFDAFDYVALGHIHKPQQLGRDTLRYAGSPMKYSFSEAAFEKSAVLVDMKEKGNCAVTLLPLKAPHDVREVKGPMSEIMSLPYSEDYVRVTVTDELVRPDARVTVSTVFPNMMKFAVENSKTKQDGNILAGDRVEERSVPELFADFFRLQNNGVAPSEDLLKLLTDVLKEVEESYEA